MKRVAVVTVGRSDYGILRPVIRAIAEHTDLELQLIVAGMHLLPEFGATITEIEADGYQPHVRVPISLSSDEPIGVAHASGMATVEFADAYAYLAPDVLLVLGDRFETHAAATAAVPLRLPIAHIHGGELTEAAIDEQYRHSITKLSHLHFVANEECARRVIQMGEEMWRVIVSGAPALDNLRFMSLAPVPEVADRHGIELAHEFLLVTYHPETLTDQQTARQIEPLLAALEPLPFDLVFTAPTGDAGYRAVRQSIETFVRTRAGAFFVTSLGTRDYFSLLSRAAAVVGNSSSGIIEAPSFRVPVVNVGDRQRGRMRTANVIDVPANASQIAAAIERATSAAFGAGLTGLTNPYGDGHAAARIVATLAETPLGRTLLRKRFHAA